MKVRSSIKKMCKHCYIVKRGKIRFVYCKETPKHKQRQGFHTMVHNYMGDSCSLCNIVSSEISSTLYNSSSKSSADALVSRSMSLSATILGNTMLSALNTNTSQSTMGSLLNVTFGGSDNVVNNPLSYVPQIGLYSILHPAQ